MIIFNYIFVSDVLSRLILFLGCFLFFARDGKQNKNYDSTENTKTNGTTIGLRQRDGSVNCFVPISCAWQAVENKYFSRPHFHNSLGVVRSVPCCGNDTNLGQNITNWDNMT